MMMLRSTKLRTWICLLMLAFLSCNTDKKEKGSDLSLRIVASTGMIEDAARNITGNKATVTSIMGPGVDPHLYKATQGDLSRLMEADIVFYNGLHLEGKMVEVFEKLAKQKLVFPVSKDIPENKLRTAPQFADSHDPHIWFDVRLWMEAVKTMSAELQKADPVNAAEFKKNTEVYLQKLDSLDNSVRAEIQSIPEKSRVLITAHDAFGYFGDAYGIEVKGLQGISTLSDFGLNDISSLVNLISSKKIKAVFVETSVPRKSIEAVVEGCKSKGHQVAIGGTLYSDAMGPEGTFEGTYIGMVTSNVKKMVGALK
jgi:manganese/zinc/iron transport system substrate-binding protein